MCIHMNSRENMYWWSGTNYEPVRMTFANWFRNDSLFAGIYYIQYHSLIVNTLYFGLNYLLSTMSMNLNQWQL